MKCPQHYLTEMQEVVLFYNGLDVPTRQILDSKGDIATKTVVDAKVTIQDMERGFGSLPSSTETNPRDHVKSISTTVEADMTPIRRIRSSQYVVSAQQNRASVSVMPLSTHLNLGLSELAHTKLTVELADRAVKYPKGIAENVLEGIGDEKIIFKSMKSASSLIKKVYMLGLRECMELDLEVRLMGETLVLNKSLDPLYGDYIELNDLNVLLELRKDQVDDLMPTI
ncbi:hypothetical protein Tco_0405092 [Tanacetum coccineum]